MPLHSPLENLQRNTDHVLFAHPEHCGKLCLVSTTIKSKATNRQNQQEARWIYSETNTHWKLLASIYRTVGEKKKKKKAVLLFSRIYLTVHFSKTWTYYIQLFSITYLTQVFKTGKKTWQQDLKTLQHWNWMTYAILFSALRLKEWHMQLSSLFARQHSE